jgi:nucleotide sugar dehydrogenase
MEAPKNLTVIGIGRLGLCFALVLERKGFNVLGVDLNGPYVQRLNDKTFVSDEPSVTDFLRESKNFVATTNLAQGVAHSNVIFVLVDTPSTGNDRHYDHSKVGSVLLALNSMGVKDKHIIISCTVLPGYIAGTGRYLIKDCENCTLSYNPEFIAQGDIIRGQLRPDMVLIGEGSQAAGDILQAVYTQQCDNQPNFARMSPESAEICKLGVNCYVTMKVTFANLIGDIADRTPGADKLQICRAIGSDSRVGGKYLTPGYGYGGPCFPRDNRALGGYAQFKGIKPLLFSATDEYNATHTQLQIEQLLASPEREFEFEGIAYKPNTRVPIVEESQRLKIAVALARDGRRVTLVDYAATLNEVKKEYGGLFIYRAKPEDE